MINFQSIPFLRILVPYLAGIFFVQKFGICSNSHLIFVTSIVALVIAFLVLKYHKPVLYFKKVLFVVCLNSFLFLLAFETCFIYDARNNPTHYTHYLTSEQQGFFCTVSDLPVNTGKFTKVPVEANAIQANGQWHYATGSSLVYLKQGVDQTLSIGDILYVTCGFGTIQPPQNPDEFNYKSFLERQNIFQVVYTDSANLHKTHTAYSSFSLTRLGCGIKGTVVSILRNVGLSQEAFSICTALLVGYDDEIESSVVTSFSHSGTLHVLSVSGMHTGVLYGILMFIFQWVDKYDRYKRTKCFLIIMVLGLFVLITGFSPSVLRAALMLALIILGKTFSRNGNSYNTLLLSAFLLLLYDPMFIGDVGFLLSYFAVFGIMYLYPILHEMYVLKNNLIRWFWSLTLMSVAATVFTLPISLYYFHQFPVWFIFSNLLIIPISIALMLAAAILLLFYKITIVTKLLVVVINAGTSAMLWFTQLTDDKTYGFIDYISFTGSDVAFSALMIILVLWIISTRQYKAVVWAFLSLTVWMCVSLFTNYKELQQKELVVFSVKHKSAYVLRIGHTAYVHRGELTEKEFQRFLKPYLLNFSGLKIVFHKSDVLKYGTGSVWVSSASAGENGEEMPSYRIVSHNSPISLKTEQNIKPLVIADCSNSYTFVKKLKAECALLGIPFYSIKEQGALRVMIDQ